MAVKREVIPSTSPEMLDSNHGGELFDIYKTITEGVRKLPGYPRNRQVAHSRGQAFLLFQFPYGDSDYTLLKKQTSLSGRQELTVTRASRAEEPETHSVTINVFSLREGRKTEVFGSALLSKSSNDGRTRTIDPAMINDNPDECLGLVREHFGELITGLENLRSRKHSMRDLFKPLVIFARDLIAK